MKNKTFSDNSYAASEVVGAIILVLIAVGAFAAIYYQVFPVPLPSADSHIKLMGYIDDERNVVIEHVGGEALISYKILSVRENGSASMSIYENQPLMIGKRLPINKTLLYNESQIRVTVWSIQKDGSEQIVFDGIITPKDRTPGSSPQPLLDPMLVSTLRDNTPDEDLICYNYTIHPNINPITFIYNWMIASTGPYTSLARVLMPFDTQNLFQTKDYSGNGYNGTINGATWTKTGKLGGAYQFDGNDFITIPYCFENNKIDKITVEVWIKTSENSGTILSYNRGKYWELAVSNGHVKWSTNSSDGTVDVIGTKLVNDNTWHLIAVTYNSSLGDCSIYVDGRLDIYQHQHAVGTLLGSGDNPAGAIGKGTGVAGVQSIFSTDFETQNERDTWNEQNSTGGQQTWTNLRYDNFNSNLGSYTDGGSDCYLTNTYKHEGTQSVCIRDNSGTGSSFYLTNSIDVNAPDYKTLKIDFWWMWNGNGWSNGEDWWLLYFNGVSWVTVLDMNYPSGHTKDIWYHEIVYINESTYIFPNNMKIWFQCDASDNNDLVYIDQVYINATSYGRIQADFILLPSTALTPHTGSYSIGGTGDFDPEYALYNRTGIDILGYSNVKISVWYSYKATESNDFLGLYYLNGSQWRPVFEINNPQITGQAPWTHVIVNVPETLHVIKLQFKWRTSSTTEYVAIDDLEITGILYTGESNFTGLIDEVKIYPRDLSPEQLYQNYLCTKDGNTNRSVIVSEEIHLDESWKCFVTPNDGIYDDLTIGDDIFLIIVNYGGGG
ncbi:MAG: hypothetical protein IMZ53_16655 [Thermoplasmata archaeon]|nr:hypothetical protein [Thermoplasmata archaeon]MBE3142204.1 hypothetical protein [Thermoplasmata archaeon]